MTEGFPGLNWGAGMSWSDFAWLKSWLLPPGIFLALSLAGFVLRGRAGRAMTLAGLLALGGLSLPFTARSMMVWLEERIEGPGPGAPAPMAIIVLAGDYRSFAPEYGEATIGQATLMRLRYAASLQRKTGLPILATGGGTPPEFTPGLADAMRIALERDFGVPVRWIESKSRNTFESAIETRRLFAAAGIPAAYLVTHAQHMPRSLQAFRAAGVTVIPAPTGGQGAWTRWEWGDLLPDSRAFERSCATLHEITGMLWYELVIRTRSATNP